MGAVGAVVAVDRAEAGEAEAVGAEAEVGRAEGPAVGVAEAGA